MTDPVREDEEWRLRDIWISWCATSELPLSDAGQPRKNSILNFSLHVYNTLREYDIKLDKILPL